VTLAPTLSSFSSPVLFPSLGHVIVVAYASLFSFRSLLRSSRLCHDLWECTFDVYLLHQWDINGINLWTVD